MGWNELDLKPHGTPAAYRRHYRNGTKPCEACRKAQSRQNADRLTQGGRTGEYEARRERYRAARAAGLGSREAFRIAGSPARFGQLLERAS
jgi:hypothetical protein